MARAFRSRTGLMAIRVALPRESRDQAIRTVTLSRDVLALLAASPLARIRRHVEIGAWIGSTLVVASAEPTGPSKRYGASKPADRLSCGLEPAWEPLHLVAISYLRARASTHCDRPLLWRRR